RNLLVLLAPAYLGYDGGDEGWYRAMAANGADKLRAYGRYVAQRFAAFDNIIWVHGGDFNPPDRALTRAVAMGMRDFLPASLATAHCGPETPAHALWGSEPWLDIDSVYSYGPIADACDSAYQAAPRRPVLLLESAYENEHRADAARTRAQAYQALLSG